MRPPLEHIARRRARFRASAGGVFSVLVGAAVLAGWMFHVPLLKSILPGLVSMKPNTALAFVMAGTALVLLAQPPLSPARARAGQGLALLVVVIGGLTLSEFVFGWHLGIDEMLFQDEPNAAATFIAGRMAPSTAACLALLGLALVGIGWEPRRDFRPAEVLVLGVTVVSLISFVEYAIGQPILYGFGRYTRMALHTAVVFLVLSAGVLLARPAQGLVGALRAGRVSPRGGAVYAAVGLALLLVVAGGGWFYHAQEQQVRHDLERNLAAIAQLKVGQIVQWRKERLADASLLMESPFITEAVAKYMATSDPMVTEELLAYFRSSSKHQHYRDVALVDTRGQVRLSLSGRRGLFDEDLAQALPAALRDRQPVLAELDAGPGDFPPHVDVIAPIVLKATGTESPCGAIILQCDAGEFLYPLIQSWPVPSSSAETLLVRRDGDAVLFLNDLRHQRDTALKLRIPVTYTNVPAVAAVLGREGFVQSRDYRGVEVVAFLNAIPDAPWFIVAKVDVGEAFATWRFRSVLILALIFGFVIAAAAVAGLAWQRKARFYRYTRNLIEANLDPLVAISAEGRITDVNEASVQATGVTREQLLGTDFSDYFTEPAKARAGYQQAFREGLVRDHELVLRHRDGHVTAVLYNASVYRDEKGAVAGVFAAARDITERKRAEEKLQRSAEELRRSNQELEHFAYVSSHDLQEPLRTVASFSQLLASRYRGRLDSDADEFIQFIVDGASRMQTLINDLLAYSRVGSRGKPFERVASEAVLRAVLDDLAQALEESRAVVTRDPLPVVMADDVQFRQLLLNLLGNALKFRTPGEPARIHVSAARHDGGWQFSVRDNGIGIDPQYFERVFIIFQRLHGRTEYPGTGIGLAVCKKIVERHAGRIWVESVPGHGSTFHFTLPERNPPP